MGKHRLSPIIIQNDPITKHTFHHRFEDKMSRYMEVVLYRVTNLSNKTISQFSLELISRSSFAFRTLQTFLIKTQQCSGFLQFQDSKTNMGLSKHA